MKSIFIEDDNAELINRINQLSAPMPALWGKMNPAQMMAHCQASINIALGNARVKRHWLGILFGNIGKKRLLKAGKLDKYTPTYKDFEMTGDLDFEEEKEKFIALIKSALIKGPQSLVKYPHPYLNTFKDDEWSQLNWMHLDHHLRQFGV
jgi:hypothetical protein